MKELIQAKTLITAHGNADFDCLSSMVATKLLYPDAVLIFPGSQEQGLRDFFIQSTTYLLNFYSYKDIDPNAVQTLVICDTRQKSRLSHIEPLLQKKDIKIHVYDHHPDTEEDLESSLEVVKPWGSTVAVLCSILQEKGISPDPDQATLMGLGLYEDTGCFTFTSTTEHDLRAALWLKQKGMDIGFLSDFLTRELSSEQVNILNNLLDSATRHNINGIEVTMAQVSTERYVRYLALLVHKMMDIENLKVIFALARMQDRIHVVARSKVAGVDVGQICSSLGGGGHSFAASATIKNKTLTQVKDELFGLLYSHINPQITVRSLMSSPAISISEKSTISQASKIMTRYGLKAIPILEEESKTCVGILEHQLADKAEAHGLGRFEVREYMLRQFSRVSPTDTMYTVMEIIIDQGQRLVPVQENGELIGVITRTDLINCLVEEPARIPEALLPERRQSKDVQHLMRNRLPDPVLELLHKAGALAQEKGYKVYAVGGFVRDILLQRPNLDIDLVVEGDGISFAEALAQMLDGRIRAHKKFRTAVVIFPDDQRIDVATARLEYYEHPAALPTVELSSIKLDLFRRDFSMNALAIELNPEHFGQLVDFFGGQKDIKDRVIRVLHSLSFVEDPTRIIRAIRFEQRFKFRIGAQTERLIKNALQLNMFQKLSGSRIFQELKLLMQESSPLECLQRMQELDILQNIHPLLKLDEKNIQLLQKVEKVLDWHELMYMDPAPEQWKLYFLALCQSYNQEQIQSLTRSLDMPKKQQDSIIHILQEVYSTEQRLYQWQKRNQSLSKLYFLLHRLPMEAILYIMACTPQENIRKHVSLYLTQLRGEKIEISGRDLKALGLSPGPAYGRILTRILTAKLDGEAKDRLDQLRLARELVHQERQKPKEPNLS
ncbi:MAG: CBS domain-containing protein [Desulfohalobiaceae bacterium]